MQSLLQRRSARQSTPAIRVRRTGDPSGVIKRGFAGMPSKLDPHVATSEGAEPQLTALAIVGD
jgi:hypothetical protein